LGRFRLEGIPPAPRGVPQIEVTFDIDANGIINVGAKDKATGKEQKVTITASTNLNEKEIDRMMREARDHETDDKKRRELVEARNAADSLAYQTEKTIKDLGDKLPANERESIQSKVTDLRETMKSEDVAKIKQKSEELQNAFYAISQQLYAQQGGAAGAGAPGAAPQSGGPAAGGYPPSGDGGGSKGDEGEVVEGEFREA
ncbi:MAG: Hsp70 family protein, partial [Chloroflexota bacterium]